VDEYISRFTDYSSQEPGIYINHPNHSNILTIVAIVTIVTIATPRLEKGGRAVRDSRGSHETLYLGGELVRIRSLSVKLNTELLKYSPWIKSTSRL
jgi:hypothetical protein